jgi:hypothetical protein
MRDNPKLLCLNLQKCRLPAPALCRLVSASRFAFSLQSLLLSGNAELNQDQMDELNRKLHVDITLKKPEIVPHAPQNLSVETKELTAAISNFEEFTAGIQLRKIAHASHFHNHAITVSQGIKSHLSLSRRLGF